MTNEQQPGGDPTRPRRAADDPYAPPQDPFSRPPEATEAYTPDPDATNQIDPDATRVAGTPAEPPQPPPRLLGGRYKLGEVIGRGGMAEVRRAYDTRLGRPVAVKELRTDLASDPTFQARFRREAQSAAGLNHPNIVAVYDTGEEHDDKTGLAIPYIVMELVEGHTLRDVLRDGRKILPERALELTQGVLDALSYSHKAGIIHRDIKPANVMLTPTGQVKVMDFGIARAVSDTSATMTQTAAVIGTAQYLSPEQARGETVDARSDIYSAGCLLYELLTGRPPFVGDSPVSVAYQHVRELPVPPSQLDPMISPEIGAIVLKSLAKDPAERYQTAREMRDDISRVLAGQDVTAMLPAPVPAATAGSPAEPEEEPLVDEEEPQKKRALPIVITVLALLLVGLLGALVWWFNRPPAPVQPAQVSVPRVAGMQEAAAVNSIRDAQLEPKVTQVAGADDRTVGTVTRQSPEGGGLATVGSPVIIEVNIGPKKIAIPTGLVGKDEDVVTQALNQAGFTNVRKVDASSEPSDAKPGQILEVSPGEGQQVTPESEITLTRATGQSQVPDWSGWNQASVERDGRAKGFTNIQFATRETNSDNAVGTVLSTDPRAGSKVDRNARITVYIGRAAPKPPPPPTTTSEPPTRTPTPTTSSTPTPEASPTPTSSATPQ